MAFFRSRDELADRAERLVPVVADGFAKHWYQLPPTLHATDRDRAIRALTIASALLAVFPLLRAVGGDRKRFERLEAALLDAIERRFPQSQALIAQAEGATVPPSGFEQSRTLHEVDQSTSLALAGWVLRQVGIEGSWAEASRLAPLLQRAVEGWWTKPDPLNPGPRFLVE